MTDTLKQIVLRHPGLVVAVSGGVDSMTLAHFINDLDPNVTMVHAVSPAVQPTATERVKRHAKQFGWKLSIVGSGEFDDSRYRSNPSDRCYFCKTHLYDRLRSTDGRVLASGANLDDLGEFRPGLRAAAERGVVHPFVLAGFNKAAVRGLAAELRLHDVAELPAQPCLSSRVETGIAILAEDLAFIDTTEIAMRAICPPTADIRCRITRRGVEIEISSDSEPYADEVARIARQASIDSGRMFVGVSPYRRGRMFVQ